MLPDPKNLPKFPRPLKPKTPPKPVSTTPKKIGRPVGSKESKPRKPYKKRTTKPKENGGYIARLANPEVMQDRKAAGLRKLEQQKLLAREKSRAVADIAPIPFDNIDWDRRLACKYDLALFAKTYLSGTFTKDWSQDQLRCIAKAQRVTLEGGYFAVAMPRSNGKTAICRACIIWSAVYGHRTYPFLIGSRAEKAEATLSYIKTQIAYNSTLLQDFPEVCYPASKIGRTAHLCRSQLYLQKPTHIEWGMETIKFPCLLLPKELADPLREKDSDLLIYVESHEAWTFKSGGAVIQTAGIDSSIRGEVGEHPLFLSMPRPDIVLLDDVQRDSTASSQIQIDKMIEIIDGAVGGLGAPGTLMAALMPCTVIRENDVADTYVNPEKKHQWRGERCKMVVSWPPGITDHGISLDTPAGKLWVKYSELQIESLRKYEDTRLSTQLYLDNREVMDENFVVSWTERYAKGVQISAQQAAMDDRFRLGDEAFAAEYQQIGKKPDDEAIIPITAVQVTEKTVNLPQRVCPVNTHSLVTFIDVQNEILFFATLAVAPDFTGVFVDYGTFPEVPKTYFYKEETSGWSLLTNLFLEAYPDMRGQLKFDSKGNPRAPLEAKIYHALSLMVRYLSNIDYTLADSTNTVIPITRIAIDTRWGSVTRVIKQFCTDTSRLKTAPKTDTPIAARNLIIPYFGEGIGPSRKQYEEISQPENWLFENQIHRHAKTCRWIWKPDTSGVYHLNVDVDRFKTFLMHRLASPQGMSGSISLFDAPPERHQMFADHICMSEHPIIQSIPGLKKETWKERENCRYDNDFFDCAVGCCALASYCGASLKEDTRPTITSRGSLSDLWQRKKMQAG